MDAPDAGRSPLLFLSHAGVDTDAALDLARRLEQTSAAQQAGLRVWIDQRDLMPGRGWQKQLEHAIEQASTAFAVYIGGRGAINWVEAEVRVALSRATKDAGYPFIPVLVGEARSADLPAFARQYHAVRIPTTANSEVLQALITAVLQSSEQGPVPVIDHPFVGLASFSQETAELFHGRQEETEQLVERLRRTNLVIVVGDSGSGKSSLARAGLTPRFRGGAFADRSGERPDPTFWQVIEMRPQGQPFERLVDAVNKAAQKVGVSQADRRELAKMVRSRDPLEIRDAIRDSAPSTSKALLLVDQFEELWTLTPEADRRAFTRVLLDIAENAGGNCRIVLTMRRDYYNLCAQFPDLFQRFEAQDAASKYQLRRMSDTALRRAIAEPLRLTEYHDDPVVNIFAEAVLEDVGDRPGDLALLEMALAEAWRHRKEHRGDLLRAYIARGRVAGALAGAAEDVFCEKLSGVPLDMIKGVFVRLVRLGDTGGTTRRIARRAEFTNETWPLVQQLAQGEHARLVSIAGEPGRETVEIAHEALATQWPRYQAWLEDAAPDKRVFDRLVEEVAEWTASGEDPRHLAQGADLDAFTTLRQTRAAWLSEAESRFVQTSEGAERARAEHEQAQVAERERLLRDRAETEEARAQDQTKAARDARRLRNRALAAAVFFLMASVAAVSFWSSAREAATKAEMAAEQARAERDLATFAADTTKRVSGVAFAKASELASITEKAVGSNSSSSKAYAYVQFALYHNHAGDWERGRQAIQLAEKVLYGNSDPIAIAHLREASGELQWGDPSAALEHYREALILFDSFEDSATDRARVIRKMASALIRQGNLDEAAQKVAEANAIIRGKPRSPERAVLLSVSGQIGLARRDYSTAIADFQLSVTHFNDSLGDAQRDLLARLALGQTLQMLGDAERWMGLAHAYDSYDQAIHSLETVLADDPTLLDALRSRQLARRGLRLLSMTERHEAAREASLERAKSGFIASFGDGVGKFRFGMASAEVNRLLKPPFGEVEMAVVPRAWEYRTSDIRYLCRFLGNVPPEKVNCGAGIQADELTSSIFPSGPDCMINYGYAVFMFFEDRLFRIVVRFYRHPDPCPARLASIDEFARRYRLTALGGYGTRRLQYETEKVGLVAYSDNEVVAFDFEHR